MTLPQTTVTLAGCNVCAGDCSDGSVTELSHLMVQTHYTLSSLYNFILQTRPIPYLCLSIRDRKSRSQCLSDSSHHLSSDLVIFCFFLRQTIYRFSILSIYNFTLATTCIKVEHGARRGIEDSVRRERVRRYFSLNYSGGFLPPLNTNSWQIGHWAAPPPH